MKKFLKTALFSLVWFKSSKLPDYQVAISTDLAKTEKAIMSKRYFFKYYVTVLVARTKVF